MELSLDGKKSKFAGEAYVFDRSSVVAPKTGMHTAKSKAHEIILEEKLKAIAQVLASFGLLDAVGKRKQERLLKAIYDILNAPEE